MVFDEAPETSYARADTLNIILDLGRSIGAAGLCWLSTFGAYAPRAYRRLRIF